MALKCFTIFTCLVLVNASPVPWTAKSTTDTRTGSPKLLVLPQSHDHVSLVPEKAPRSEGTSQVTPSSSTDSDRQLIVGGAESTVQHDVTSAVTEHRSRGIRSVTSQETLLPEETTAVPATEKMTADPAREETIVSTTAEATTTSATMATTLAVDLDKRTLENASKTVRKVLASAYYELHTPEIKANFTFLYDELSRPMLPEDIVENAKQCVQIQAMLRTIHEVVQDFVSYSEGVTFLTGRTYVKSALLSLDRQILKLISPFYEYTPTPAPGTDEKNTEAVATTLYALYDQASVLDEVIIHLKSC